MNSANRNGQTPIAAAAQTRLHAFTNAFQPVRRAWIQAAAAATADCEVSFAVATAMVLLARAGDCLQQSALAEAAGVNPAAMLRTLDQAEVAELCCRCSVPENRRIKIIRLLPKGKALVQLVEDRLNELRQELFGDIDPDEVETATRVLRLFERRILEHLSSSGSP